MHRKLLLLILDGWGYNESEYGNAILQANTPNFDNLWKEYPHTLLESSGKSVGLPDGQMGTSEVNHMVMGSGRIIFQDLERINKSIENGTLRENKSILQAMQYVVEKESTLHMQGLLSDGGVHSHINHIFSLIDMAKEVGVRNFVFHVFTDGRDVPVKSALKYIEQLEKKLEETGIGRIGTIEGRYFAMDRDNQMERLEKAYLAIQKGEGLKFKSAEEAIEKAYERGETDEFITPSVIENKEGEINAVGVDDAVIFVNFRSDRARELTNRMIADPQLKKHFVAMSQYSDDMDCSIAFPQEDISNTFSEVVSKNDLTQLKIAETEKFNHVTYFFNCRKLKAYEGEDRIVIDSYSDIPTHDKKPQMRARDITREAVQDIEDKVHDVLVLNICNADMLGHTGNIPATIKGLEIVDECIGKLKDVCEKNKYEFILTADHGNAEEMLYPDGTPETSHSTFPVPFIIANKDIVLNEVHSGLDDIAPTLLSILGIQLPKEMTGTSMIK